MGSWELGAVPINGAFTRGNESQTTVWTVTDNGSLLMSMDQLPLLLYMAWK
jgi:hypothetical protein